MQEPCLYPKDYPLARRSESFRNAKMQCGRPSCAMTVLREMHSLSFLFAEKKPVMARFPLYVFPIDRFPRNSMHKEQNLPQIALRACISNKYWHESPGLDAFSKTRMHYKLLASPQQKHHASTHARKALSQRQERTKVAALLLCVEGRHSPSPVQQTQTKKKATP